MSIVRTFTGSSKPRFITPQMVCDGAANRFTARVFNRDGTAANTVVVVTKVTPAGVRSDIATFHSENGGKFDGCGLVQTGPHLIVVTEAHVGDPTTQEEEFVIENVCVPYPAGQPQVGMAGAFLPTQVEEIPVDYALIRTIAREEAIASNAALIQAFGGNVRAGIEDKAKSALYEMMDDSVIEEGSEGAFRAKLDLFIEQRCYEALESYFGKKPKP
jgi:hypothetical protein